MEKKFLKKIIAQSQEDLQIISACCADSKVKNSEIKYLSSNKIFLMSLLRLDKENNDNNKNINSVIKFEFVDSSKAKNINQNDKELVLELLAIDILKKEYNFEITLLFSKNRFITLTTEVIEATLEDQTIVNDKSF
tara:strand:- start:400 stop:807 length:408 start_codon:yes stop_codon:yes gene_type:complete